MVMPTDSLAMTAWSSSLMICVTCSGVSGLVMCLIMDKCHVVCLTSRWALAVQNLHPEIKRFCTEALHAVETWHYDMNHVGIWGNFFVHPHDLLQLDDINSAVCEQRFGHVNQFSGGVRQMRKERFQWMLLKIADLDHQFRAKGMI